MANYTTYANGVSTITDSKTLTNPPCTTYMTQDIDVAKIGTVTTSDNIQLFTLPQGAFVEEVTVQVLTADAGGGGINVGDAAVATGYGNYATLSATGMLAIPAGSATTYLYTNTTNAKVKPKLVSNANEANFRIAPTTASLTTLKARVTVKLLMP